MSEQERMRLTAEIVGLKALKEKVAGTSCEVYSRVCGYLRPTKYWNSGKKEEFLMRKLYDKNIKIR